MKEQNDPRAIVLRTLEVPNLKALVETMQACVDLQLVFDVQLREYDIHGGNCYPRFTVVVYGGTLQPFKLGGDGNV